MLFSLNLTYIIHQDLDIPDGTTVAGRRDEEVLEMMDIDQGVHESSGNNQRSAASVATLARVTEVK